MCGNSFSILETAYFVKQAERVSEQNRLKEWVSKKCDKAASLCKATWFENHIYRRIVALWFFFFLQRRCQFISQNGFSVTEDWCNYTIEVRIFEAVDNEKRSAWENSAPDAADILGQ